MRKIVFACLCGAVITHADAKQIDDDRRLYDKARAEYMSCLEGHAATLAFTSTETADIVAQAALFSCSSERSKVLASHQINEGAMSVADSLLEKRLLSEIVLLRAKGNAENSQRER